MALFYVRADDDNGQGHDLFVRADNETLAARAMLKHYERDDSEFEAIGVYWLPDNIMANNGAIGWASLPYKQVKDKPNGWIKD